VHVAPACAGSREGSDRFGSYVRSLSLHFCKRLFPGTHDLMVTRQQLYCRARAPLLQQTWHKRVKIQWLEMRKKNTSFVTIVVSSCLPLVCDQENECYLKYPMMERDPHEGRRPTIHVISIHQLNIQ
jgi:hypothetical protein